MKKFQIVFFIFVVLLSGCASSRFASNHLWEAISNNDTEKAKNFIYSRADANQKNSYGNPIIHHAVSTGNKEIVEFLIFKGADVNAKGQFDRVALHYANKKGMANTLLMHGATVDAPTNYGETPLHWAASGVNGFGKHVDLVEFADVLIAHGADVNKKTGAGRSYKTPLNYAAESNNLPVAKLLIARAADVEGGGSSPLSSAGVNGDFVEMAQLLVENGAKVNVPSPTGWYPLMTAAGRGNIRVTNYLLAQGANPNATDKNGLTALYSAAGSDYGASAAETLLKHGANINATYLSGLTALHQAASQGATKVIEVLLAHGANVDAKTNSGHTPLYMAINLGAVRKGGLGVAEILLKKGANSMVMNSHRRDAPFHVAIIRGDIELVKMLIAYGAKADNYTISIARGDDMTTLLKSSLQ